MTTVFSRGTPDTVISADERRRAIEAALELSGSTERVLVLPPDATRSHSGAGALTRMIYEAAPDADPFHVMPALGTHFPMTDAEIEDMFGTEIPRDAFKKHRWREELAHLGTVPAEFVHEVSDGVLRDTMPDYDVPAEVNERIVGGRYDAILSVGQVVPHEVIGMANGFKNVLVGAGGQRTINRSHFLGAAYGMERIMGRAETPVRDVLNYAHDHYLSDVGIVYVLTVMGPDETGRTVMRGLYVGDDHETFAQAARLSRQVNVTLLDEAPSRMVVYLDPEEFKSTWLGNKAIYRTRMAIADDGELTVIAPGVRTFGEDEEIDRLIRRHGYRGTPATLEAVAGDDELRENLSAAAHLIHGSSEDRFRITYCTDPDLMSREEIEAVGFQWGPVDEAMRRYQPEDRQDGPQDGFYFIRRPALGLWTFREKFQD